MAPRIEMTGPFVPATIPLKDVHRARCPAPPEALFDRVLGLGGEEGWHGTDALWRLRGAVDRLFGGVGMRKGRRDPARLRPGDQVDFWRVDAVGPGRRLLLRAEMKNPGVAWLELVALAAPGGSELVLTSYFSPAPFWGRLYYLPSYPAHWLVFERMARDVARAAGTRAEPDAGGTGAG